jgi:hypothetical protein
MVSTASIVLANEEAYLVTAVSYSSKMLKSLLLGVLI